MNKCKIKLIIFFYMSMSFAFNNCVQARNINLYKTFSDCSDLICQLYSKCDYIYDDWYLNQEDSGKYWADNCGPAVSTMALKWLHGSFNKNVEYARNQCKPNGEWWTTDDVQNYINMNGGICSQVSFYSYEYIKENIDLGNIFIACINANKIEVATNSDKKIGRYYDSGSGHFIIIKGYKMINGKDYLVVYDPVGGSAKGDLGKNRLYEYSQAKEAIEARWKYLIKVPKKTF